MYTLTAIRERLVAVEPERINLDANTRQAAVAVVFRERFNDLEILFIKRTKSANDPWSGHMAMPGGHRDELETLCEAAMRETLEETGVQLVSDDFLGELSYQRGAPRGRVTNMVVAPFVFGFAGEHTFEPNNEVADVIWGSLRGMMSGALHTTESQPVGAGAQVFDGYRLSPHHFVWGLTYRTLQTLFAALDPSYQRPLETV